MPNEALDFAMLASMPPAARREYMEAEEAVLSLLLVLGVEREPEVRAWLVTAEPQAVTAAVRVAATTGLFPPAP